MRTIGFKKCIGWIVVVLPAIVIKIISANPLWVEHYYSYGLYPVISTTLRFTLGWIPFSMGDIFYITAIVWVSYKIVRLVKRIRRKQFSKLYLYRTLRKMIFVLLTTYVAFYGLWGLNYSRQGIASQLQLKEQEYTTPDLDTLVGLLSSKLNEHARFLKPAMRDSFKSKSNLFLNASLLYKIAATKYPFLAHKGYSVKPSLFSYLGNYMGFQGYYNPFTGEAQVNTTIPLSVEPFVASHEIAHQLGYAKESEANFVGFLACRLHPSVNFKYSVYFDMYHYAIRELAFADSVSAKSYDSALHSQVKKDIADYIAFYKKYRNPVEPYIDKMYSYFLKANNQPKGRRSYNEVVTWLIAYYKKYGKEAI
jgi:hypothetical protein